ncbi:MAG: hypothetical protein M3O46_01515 [Myxococcota bacterium]|nr:hypothetical protein [Myxococcota bacterium]
MTQAVGPIAAYVQKATAPQVTPVAPLSGALALDFRSLLHAPPRGTLQASPESSERRIGYGSAYNHPSVASRKHSEGSPSPSATTALNSHAKDPDPDDALDPIHRHHAAFAPLESLSGQVVSPAAHSASFTLPQADTTSNVRAATSLEDLLPALVRRIAWSGDRHRGSVRLELGAGELAGATLLVHAENGQVRVHLDVPPGTDAARWHQRICDRLASRGVQAAVEVT